MSLVAHDVAGEDGADDAGHGAYDVFETEHMASDEGRDVEVVACTRVSLQCVVMFLMPGQAKPLTHTILTSVPRHRKCAEHDSERYRDNDGDGLRYRYD